MEATLASHVFTFLFLCLSPVSLGRYCEINVAKSEGEVGWKKRHKGRWTDHTGRGGKVPIEGGVETFCALGTSSNHDFAMCQKIAPFPMNLQPRKETFELSPDGQIRGLQIFVE